MFSKHTFKNICSRVTSFHPQVQGGWMRMSVLLLLASFLCPLVVSPLYAQYDPLSFVILNAEDRTLVDDLGHNWDPENGVWMGSTLGLPERNDLDVFVTNEVCADSIVAWSKSNAPRHRDLISAFVNEYRQRGWLLHRHTSAYELSDVNQIAQDIYKQYPEAVDFWNNMTSDDRGVYSVALLLHPQDGGAFEIVVLTESITKYDGDEANCPIYYKNRTELSNVETTRQRTHFRRQHGTASSDGTWLTFNENFHIEGPEDQRLVIDRVVNTCNFESDLNVVKSDFQNEPMQYDMAIKYLDIASRKEDFSYRLRPFVYAGEDFQRQLYRRTRGNLLRDTLEHYRVNTIAHMEELRNWVEYREIQPDSMLFLIPQPLWKLVLRYRTFDRIRDRVRMSAPWIPLEVNEEDTVQAYIANTPFDIFSEFQAYVDSGHVIADHHVITSERDLVEGFVSRQNQMNLYPVPGESRRVRIEHRDTLASSVKPLMLTMEPVDTVLSYRWRMPDPTRYYQLRHINYLHDFIHADTTSSIECGCERQMPLQFLNISTQNAEFDCPPRRSITSDRLVSFKPRARGELVDATYSLALSFELLSTEVNLDLGNNRAQMDSLVQKAYEITHDMYQRIQQVGIVGISSPEGGQSMNLHLSRQRSLSILNHLRSMGGEDLRHANFHIIKDSIAPWSAVADIIEAQHPENTAAINRVRSAVEANPNNMKAQQNMIGFTSRQRDPAIDAALDQLREAQVTFSYKAVFEASEAMIIDEFRSAKRYDNFPPDYYYWILTSKLTTYEEKGMVAKALLKARASDVRRFTTDQHPSNSFGLVLPIAANFLALDSMRNGRYNPEILAPFINSDLFQGNFACYMQSDYDVPVKFINLDAILYNQIVTLYNVGTPEAIDQAYTLADILNETPTLSSQFREKYHPEQLEILLNSYMGRFLDDPDHLEMLRKSNLRNFYVANMADMYSKCDGVIDALQTAENCHELLEQCVDSLQELKLRFPGDPAALYFTAITRLWQAESIGGEDRDANFDLAIDALEQLFKIDVQPTYISRLQGDSYVRNFYRTPRSRKMKRDIFLEAVEQFISNTYKE